MEKVVANMLRIPQDTAFQIEMGVQDKAREYIDSYTSSLPLSEAWVKRKGNDKFFRNTDYSYYLFGIRFLTVPSKWDEYEIDVSDDFKYASYMYVPSKEAYRAFLPNGEPSFDDAGLPTQDLFNFVDDIILSLLDIHFPDFTGALEE